MQITNNIFFVDEINNLAKNDKNLLISMSEEMYHDQIEDLVNQIIARKNIKILLIAGPSSSGKTTTSKLVMKTLKQHKIKSVCVSLDDFFLDREKTPLLPNGNYDYENVTAIDLDCFNNFIDDLFKNNCAHMPHYNFLTGKREQKLSEIKIDNKTIVIVEGLHALNPTIIKNDSYKDRLFKLYLCALSNFNYNDSQLIDNKQLRLMRRLIRDYYTRGRTIEETIVGWQEVLDGEEKYIDPYKDEADFFIDSTHIYEPLLYANYLLPLLKNTNLSLAKSLEEKLEKCDKLNKNIIPKNSLIKEFIK